APRLPRGADVARRQLGVVSPHGAHADGDGIAAGAKLVDESPALLAGDPTRVRQRHASVEAHGRLVGDEGPTLRDPGSPGLVLLARAEAELAFCQLDLDPGRAEQLDPARGVRVRVLRSDDDPG